MSFRGSEATVGISSKKERYFYAPINIVYLEFSMLIGLFSFGTTLLEIATGLTALAMTVVRVACCAYTIAKLNDHLAPHDRTG